MLLMLYHPAVASIIFYVGAGAAGRRLIRKDGSVVGVELGVPNTSIAIYQSIATVVWVDARLDKRQSS
ncbi:unnamed protein product [Pleuronectes platessa]|uniref:Uncharacterized protein n=1 Tax=Pleuronectes platessa TaxID=8262 RepID=A0A9N7V542_PLEPL|nr:unnamed protein product [Pleuronectes platessa]